MLIAEASLATNPMLDHYISQTAQEESLFLFQILRISDRQHDDARSLSPIARASMMQRELTYLDEVLKAGNVSIACPYAFAGCPFTSAFKTKWMDHIQRYHIQVCHCTKIASLGQPFDGIRHTFQSELLPASISKQRACPKIMQCSVPGCSMQFSGADPLRQWLDHLYMHLKQQFAIPDYLHTISEAIEGNNDFIQWSSNSDIGIIHRAAPDGRWRLYTCFCKLPDDPGPPSSDIVSRMEACKEDYATVSSCSLSLFSLAKDEVFSHKSSPTTKADSVRSFSNHDDTALHDLRSEQVSRSDLIDEIVHFILSWSVTQRANRAGNIQSNPGTQETQSPDGRDQGQSSEGTKRKSEAQGVNNAKRIRITGSDETNRDEPEDGNRGTPTTTCDQLNYDSSQMLACPFHQRRPEDYGVGKWELCTIGGWKTFHRVREHLIRKHIRPQFFCNRCFEDFKDDESLQKHYDSPCEGKQSSPYLNLDQQAQLKAPTVRGMPEPDKWKHSYGKIFPGENIPSPYKIEPWPMDDRRRLYSLIEIVVNIPRDHEGRRQILQQIFHILEKMGNNSDATVGGGQESGRQVRNGIENEMNNNTRAELDTMIENVPLPELDNTLDPASTGAVNILGNQFLLSGEAAGIPPGDSGRDPWMGAGNLLTDDDFPQDTNDASAWGMDDSNFKYFDFFRSPDV